jgi:hypothetical protein
MHYQTGKETLKLGPASRFLSEMGIGQLEPIAVLKVSKAGLSDETQVVLLARAES